METLQETAKKVRKLILEMSYNAQTAHIGSNLSCVEILVASYFHALNINPNNWGDLTRDRLILSKGHAAVALYSCLYLKEFINNINDYCKEGSNLGEQPIANVVPGLEIACGSLGHGLPFGVGCALANRLSKIFVIVSEGDIEEGSSWESIMFAPIHRLNNLTLFIDYNKWQATGRSYEIMQLEPLRKKFLAFGWDAYEIDGHNLSEIIKTIDIQTEKPKCIICHTVKGKGVSFCEDSNDWHYRHLTKEEYEKSICEQNN